MTSLFGKFSDGGPLFTYPIFILLIIVLALFAKGIMDKNDNSKTISLIAHLGWFAVAWGFLGRTFGLIHAFDNVAAHGELTPNLLADGLKMALVDPLFGIIVFAIARAGIIALVWIQKEKNLPEKPD